MILRNLVLWLGLSMRLTCRPVRWRKLSWLLLFFMHPSMAADHWFERYKASATPAELYQFLYAMPKGGDLHLHLSGSVLSRWYYELALAQSDNGYVYYAKQHINNCAGAAEEARPVPYLLLQHTVDHLTYAQLSDCEKTEYVDLATLSEAQTARWLSSIVLDKAHEGRDEFFENHWNRLGDLLRNPYLMAEVLVANMRAFGDEGLIYIEPQVPIFGFVTASGEALSLEIYTDRLAQADAKATGVEVRMQVSLLRFLPDAEETLKVLYAFASKHSVIVAVNMVGREDNDKGYPLRFLSTLRMLRQTQGGVRLSIHAGEVDEPNHHIRDTLLLGAERIGHGFNLITDPDTLRLMRYGPYLIEISLISNLLLEYVDDFSRHPFPEYLRLGVPIALATDDRGMWDSTMTDEFFVAVTEFSLSWDEIVTLSRNALEYSFLDETTKTKLLARFDRRIEKFVRQVQTRDGFVWTKPPAPKLGLICRTYNLCPVMQNEMEN